MTPKLELGLRPARVLVVDDERTNRELLEVMLSGDGLGVVMAASGEEALERVRGDSPDLVLLDVMMPGMNGYQVANALKGDPTTRNIPIIMITALDDRESRMLGLGAGAEDFVSKPVDRAELCMRVRNLLRLKSYADRHDQYGRMLEEEIEARSAALVESERLYRSTFEMAPVGIVHMNQHGDWVRVNQRLCDMLGYTREELENTEMPMISPTDAGVEELAAMRRLTEGSLDRYVVDEKRYRRRDGTVVWARVNISVHRDAAGELQHLILVMEDITRRRVLEEQLRQASKMDALGQLAAGIAHDFNNVLSVVLSYSEMLAEKLAPGTSMHGDLDAIHTAGLRAAELTRQLLVFGRKQLLKPKVLDLVEVVARTGKMLRRLIGADIELSVVGQAGRAKVLVDPGQMEQVLMNLVVNARDAMPRGGKLRIETIEVLLDEAFAREHQGVTAGAHVRLAVSDTGTGMDLATQARIFEPFFTTKGVGQGTGIGLATVFAIVQQSGGTISVASELGSGTTFKIYFPMVEAAVEVEVHPSPTAPRLPSGDETILVVEDDQSVRGVVCMILRRCGYEVLEAQGPGDAFLLCEQHAAAIHLLVTDVVMPLMSGRELSERLLERRPEMQVLYMSGYTDDAILRAGVLGSTVAFLQKPITSDALSRKVREMLGVRHGGGDGPELDASTRT